MGETGVAFVVVGHSFAHYVPQIDQTCQLQGKCAKTQHHLFSSNIFFCSHKAYQPTAADSLMPIWQLLRSAHNTNSISALESPNNAKSPVTQQMNQQNDDQIFHEDEVQRESKTQKLQLFRIGTEGNWVFMDNVETARAHFVAGNVVHAGLVEVVWKKNGDSWLAGYTVVLGELPVGMQSIQVYHSDITFKKHQPVSNCLNSNKIDFISHYDQLLPTNLYSTFKKKNWNLFFIIMIQPEFFQPEQQLFCQTIGKYHPEELPQKKVVLSGFPYDEGTRRNGGRVGGCVAPKIFRQTMSKRLVYPRHRILVEDAGDLPEDLQLEEAHRLLEEKHKEILSNSKGLLVGLGGSNDQSYPNVSALMHNNPNQRIAVVNLDSHFDVRPLIDGQPHSGSPFRLMLQDPRFNNSIFVEFGVKGSACSNSHAEYLTNKGAEIIWLQKHIRRFKVKEHSTGLMTQAGQMFANLLQRLSKQVSVIFVSFDLDVIACRWMPGVSAPSVAGGLTAEEAIEICSVAGSCPAVRLMDFSEFNPAVESILSSSLLVDMFFEVSMAFAERPQ